MFFAQSSCALGEEIQSPLNVSKEAVIITGLAGQEYKYKRFFDLAARKTYQVLAANGYSESSIHYFSDHGEDTKNSGIQSRLASGNNLKTFFEEIKGRHPEELFLFIAGHANGRDENTVLHLPGEDIRYQELLDLVRGVQAKRLIVVAAVPQGETWIKALSGPGRIILAGGGYRQFDFIPVVFLRLFPEVFWGLGMKEKEGALQGDEKASLTDMFMEAQQKIQNWYWMNSLQATEIALLDGDGDGVGKSLILESRPIEDPRLKERQQKMAELAGKNPEEAANQAAGKVLGLEFVMDAEAPDAKIADEIYFIRPGGRAGIQKTAVS